MSKLSANYKYLVPTATEQEVIMFSNIARDLYQEFNLYSDVDGKENQITGLLPEKYPTYTDYLNLLNRKITEISNGNYNEINIEVARRNLITLDNIKNTIEHVIYTFGSILDGYTTIENILDEQIICYDISDLSQMKAEIFDVVIFNVISLCWDNCVANGIRINQMEYEGKIEKWDKVKTLILIDEAHRWVNTKKEHALDLVTKYLREARKYNGGITLASQSIRDFVPEGGTGVAIDKIKTVFELTQYKFIFNQDTNVIDLINNVKSWGIKIHLLYILKNSRLEKYYYEHPFKIYEKDEYTDTVAKLIERLNPEIVIHRLTGDAKKDDLAMPLWSADKRSVLNEIQKKLKLKNTFQGKEYKK